MNENNCIENLTNQFDNIQNIYNGYLSDPANDGGLINLCVAIFDYIGFNIVSPNGFNIINMDLKKQENIFKDPEISELEKSRAIFRIVLFLTINYQIFTHFIGLLSNNGRKYPRRRL